MLRTEESKYSMISFILSLLINVQIFAQEKLEPIKISSEEETKENFQLTLDKKSHLTRLKDLPPAQTNVTRQTLVLLPGLHTPEQTTEPWMILNYRGIGSPQEGQGLLIFQDGLPVAMDMYGIPDHLYSPPIPLMDRVQLISGGSSLIYGPTPVATINFLTPELNPNMPLQGRFNIAYGSYNLFSTVNSVMGSQKNFSYFLGFHRKQGDGYQRVNADFSSDDLQFKSKYFLGGNFTLKKSLEMHTSDFGMPGGMSLSNGAGLNQWGIDNRNPTRKYNRLKLARAQLMLGAEKKLSASTKVDLELWGVMYRKYNKTQRGSGFGKFPTLQSNSINTTHVYSLNGQLKLKHEYNQHALILGYLSYNTNSPSVNEQGSAPDSNHGVVTSRLDGKTRVQALFLENRWRWGRFSLTPGLRYENIILKMNDDSFNRRADYNILIGGIGTSYAFNSNKKLFFNFSQGFRPLGFDEVIAQGNPNYTVQGDRKPSYSYIYEGGYEFSDASFKGSLGLFLIRRENIMASSGSFLSNASDAENKGIEANIQYNLKGRFELFTNYTFVNAVFNRGQFSGKTPAHVPASLIKAGVTYRAQDRARMTLLNTYVHEHFSDDIHTASYKVPSYHLQDFVGEYYFSSHWSLNAGIYNLLDLEYYARVMPTGVMPTMGRNFILGLNYLID